MSTMFDSVVYIHLNFYKNSIECVSKYLEHESRYILSHGQDILYDNNARCEDYFDHICKQLIGDTWHPLHNVLKKDSYERANLPFARAVVITSNSKKQLDQHCDKLKNHFISVLKKFIEVFQFYFCTKDVKFYFHMDFCSQHYYYMTPYLLYSLYKNFKNTICPIPITIDLKKSYSDKDLEEIAKKQLTLPEKPEEKCEVKKPPCDLVALTSEPKEVVHIIQKTKETEKMDKVCDLNIPSSENHGCCQFFMPSKKAPPVLTLGKCFHWDSKNVGGHYKIDMSESIKKSTTPNLNALAKFLYHYHGVVAWHSDSHGLTTVCMDSVHQLIDALEDPVQVKLLIEGRSDKISS